MRLVLRVAPLALTLVAGFVVTGCDGPSPAAPEPDPAQVRTAPREEQGFSCPGPGLARERLRALWSDVDRRYALFEIRLPDQSWDDLGRTACESLGDDTSDRATFEVLHDLLRNLDDGHVNLVAPALGRDADAQTSRYPHARTMRALRAIVETRYLDGEVSRAARGALAWGRIGEVGYLRLGRLEELADGSERGDRTAVRRAMARASEDLDAASGVIVDVRTNGGGWDSAGLEVARWFAGERELAWSEQRRDGPGHDDFGNPRHVHVPAARPAAYRGPVVLLTSGLTFSAAETFALAMRVRDHVTIVGEPSAGHFSDLVSGRLPGGWRHTLSGLLFTASDGEVYEGRGVPVDVVAGPARGDLGRGRDTMLEAALRTLSSQAR